MALFTDDELKQPALLDGTNARMLTVLADLGMSKHVLAALLGLDRVHPDHTRFLTGPIVQHQSPWASSTPEWLYQAVISDRVRIILDEHESGQPGWRVGPAELAAVIYPASLEAPLQTEYAELYMWATARAYARHKDKPLDEVWQALGGDPVPDSRYDKPGSHHYQCYNRLCRDIRRAVIAAAKDRERDKRTKRAAPRSDASDIEQLALF